MKRKRKNDVENLAKKSTNNPETEEKKVQKKNSLPSSYLTFSELGKNLVQNWPLVFPNLNQLPQYSLQQLDDATNGLAAAILEAQNLDIAKKANTLKLKKVNTLLNTGVTKLRQYVRDEFADKEEQAVQLATYGLVKDSNDFYILPTDNNSREQALPRLIAYFANSPFINRNFGLAQWQSAQSEHQTHWVESERLRGARSNITVDLATQFALLKKIAKHIYQYIKVAFPAAQVAAKRREIGFLTESF